MSGYLGGILVILSLNTILAYAVFLPVAAGQLNLGGAAFQAVGAYVAGYLSTVYGLSLPLMLLAGAATSGFISFLLALTILRTKGVYLVLATFAFAQFIGGVIINMDVLGGAMGMTVPEHVGGGVIIVAAILVVGCMALLMQTRFGLAMRAIHDDDIVAELMGIGVRRTQVAAFTIGGVIAGIAGGLYACYFNFVEVQNFDSVSSVYLLLFVLLGGTQTVWGPLIGATFFTIVPELFRFVVAHIGMAGATGQLDTSWRFIILGVITVLMRALRPEGVLTRTGLGRLLGRARPAIPAAVGEA
jgi:branched-chain amino acid transport system permease protein